ncbi:16250_t:CDS:1, partial [Cetraspora pellucida]
MNLPAILILRKGSHVMYLDNTLFDHGLCNGTVDIIIELIDENTVNVIFPTSQSVITAMIRRTTKWFILN